MTCLPLQIVNWVDCNGLVNLKIYFLAPTNDLGQSSFLISKFGCADNCPNLFSIFQDTNQDGNLDFQDFDGLSNMFLRIFLSCGLVE